MKIQDKVIIVAVSLLVLLQFYLPFITDNTGDQNALTALKYGDIHWGFYYIFAVGGSLIVSLIIFIFVCTDKYRKFYLRADLVWYVSVGILCVFGIPLESFLKANPEIGILTYSRITAVWVVTFMSLILIGLVHLLAAIHEQMLKDMKQSSNEKFDSFLKNKKIVYKTTVYFSKKWYFMFIRIKPSKIALTSNEIVIATNKDYLVIPYRSIKDIKKNRGGKINGGMYTPFRLILQNDTVYRIAWTTEGGIVGDYDKTMKIYDKVYRLWKGENVEIESEEKTKISPGTYLRYFVYSSLLYSAVVITKDIRIIIATIVSIGAVEYFIKHKKKYKNT